MTKRYLFLLACLATVGLASPALAQPVGPEFQVNTFTTDLQRNSSVSSDSAGNFVVVWDSFATQQDGDLPGIFGQLYDSRGNRVGLEFQVNTYTTGVQRTPPVAADASGNFIVAW